MRTHQTRKVSLKILFKLYLNTTLIFPPFIDYSPFCFKGKEKVLAASFLDIEIRLYKII